MSDLDARIDAVLEHHEERERERKAKEARNDPHILQKVIGAAFDKAKRAQRLDEVRARTTIQIIEC
jgi:hypothetical protein